MEKGSDGKNDDREGMGCCQSSRAQPRWDSNSARAKTIKEWALEEKLPSAANLGKYEVHSKTVAFSPVLTGRSQPLQTSGIIAACKRGPNQCRERNGVEFTEEQHPRDASRHGSVEAAQANTARTGKA